MYIIKSYVPNSMYSSIHHVGIIILYVGGTWFNHELFNLYKPDKITTGLIYKI